MFHPDKESVMLRTALASLLASCLCVLPTVGHADPTFPNRPIRIINPFPTGGTTDAMARQIGEELTKAWGQPVLVESRPGAAGNIAVQFVAKSAPDGYTIVLGTQGTHGTNMVLFKDLQFDPFKDFTPITMVASAPLLLVVNPKTPAKTVQELVAFGKSQPSGLSFASTSVGGGPHLAGEVFKRSSGLNLTHVPYKGSGPAKTDLLGGHVNLLFDNIASSLPAAQAGQLRALAVTGEKRSGAAPDIPTMIESGFPGFVVDGWYALYVPAATPPEIVRKLNTETVRILRDPKVSERFKGLGLDIVASTPAEATQRMRADLDRYSKVIREAGIQPE
jgi:tripartite-type tricarboxylate transporter receptor subunit TctC